jgi:SSS family transporter
MALSKKIALYPKKCYLCSPKKQKKSTLCRLKNAHTSMLITFIALYLGATLLIGWWAARRVKTAKDFAIASKQLPLFVSASGLFATWFGSETVLGASSEFVQHGLMGVIEDPFGAALCLLLVGLFFARPLYRLNITTFCDFYKLRFNKHAEMLSAFLIIPSYFGWIAAQLIAMAIILNVLSGLPIVYGVLLCATAVVFYTYIGGMWAVAVTDTMQTVVIIFGLIFITHQLVGQAGGIAHIVNSTPDGFFRFFPKENNPVSYITYFAAWITIGLGSIPQQDIFQRVAAAKSDQTAVHASYLGSAMYLGIAVLPLIIGLCGKIIAPQLLSGDSQLFLPNLILRYTPITIQIIFFGALLSAILSTASGAILAPATVVGENLIQPLYKHQLTDRQQLRIMRISVLGVALVSTVMAMLKNNIFELVGEASAISLVSLFVPLSAGLYWQRATASGAIASMVAGTAVWLWCYNGHEYLDIPALIWGLLASFLAMGLFSIFDSKTTRDSAKVQHNVLLSRALAA